MDLQIAPPERFFSADASEKMQLAMERFQDILEIVRFNDTVAYPAPLARGRGGMRSLSGSNQLEGVLNPFSPSFSPLLAGHELQCYLATLPDAKLVQGAELISELGRQTCFAFQTPSDSSVFFAARYPRLIEINFGWVLSQRKGLIAFDQTDQSYKARFHPQTKRVRLLIATYSSLFGEGGDARQDDVLLLAEASLDGTQVWPVGFLRPSKSLNYGRDFTHDKNFSLVKKDTPQGIIHFSEHGDSFTFTQERGVNHALVISYGVQCFVKS